MAPVVPTLISHIAFTGGTGTGGTTGAISTIGANIIVIAFGASAGSGFTLTDSKGNAWTPRALANATAQQSRILYCISPTVDAAHTFTISGTQCGICVAAFSNGAGGTDQTNSAIQNSIGTTLQPGSITPGQNGELIASSFSVSAIGVVSIDSGFVITDQAIPTGAYGCALAYLVQNTAAAINPTWTVPSEPSLAACIASFKAG